MGKTCVPYLAGSYFYAFEDKKLAGEYIGNSQDSVLSPSACLRVFEAEAEVVKGSPVYTLDDHIDTFWEEGWYNFDLGWPLVIPCPPGTVWCRSIKLLDVVDTDGRSIKPEMNAKRKAQMWSPGVRTRTPSYSKVW